MTSEPWRLVAPEAFAAFDGVEATAGTALEPSLLGPVRVSVAAILGNEAELEATPAEGDPSGPDDQIGACVRFAEQFVIDVNGLSDDDRAALQGVLGPEVFSFVQTLFVVDVFQRARLALGRLHDVGYRPAPPPRRGNLWGDLELFMRAVALEGALDPVTTELVRLRGAAVHNCRLCRSRLSVRAIDTAGGTTIFSAVEDYEQSSLSWRHKVALRLTDAVITQPSLIDDLLTSQVHDTLTTAESTELVLDVVRNSANKIAVALGADAPNVTGAVEFFDVDGSGEVIADLDADAVRRAIAR